ncbi:hypothetical protein [Glaciimonas sp. PCH181]|uniref:hypothetical protein n=1 Tax=Glaciimonas sp. PCH181 TaxID=2133943 RepID=UPI001374B531|nr:hypothetical protein [Glaciimonas sp. PCH181]
MNTADRENHHSPLPRSGNQVDKSRHSAAIVLPQKSTEVINPIVVPSATHCAEQQLLPSEDQAPAEKNFFTDLTQMLQHAPAAPTIQQEQTSGCFLMSGVQAAQNTAFLGKSWKIIIDGRREQRRVEIERHRLERAFYARFTFNPFSDTFTTFIDEALGILFEDAGLEKKDIYQVIHGVFFDVRNVNAPYAQLLPTQEHGTKYTNSWNIKEIAAGLPFYLIAEKAGHITAHNADIKYDWPDNIPPHLQNLLTNGWLWRTFTKFMTLRLASGPIYDAARRGIKASLSEQFSRTFSKVPADSDTQLNEFLNNCREVKYKGITVAGMIMTPPTQKNTNGVLYFMDSDLMPVVVKEATFRLDDPRIREAVKRGLPTKTVIEKGDQLFAKHWSNPPLRDMWPPSLAFAKRDTAVNIIWNAAVQKFANDMDLAILSNAEKWTMLGLGMAQTLMKAMLVIGAPQANSLILFIAGIMVTLPDAGMALVADNPIAAEEYRSNFLMGLAIEIVGMSFFLGHKTIIHKQAAKIIHRFKSTSDAKQAEETALAEWATNYKNFMNLPAHEKFIYLAQNAVAEPEGGLAKRLMHKAMSWDVVGRLEYRAGLITKMELDELSANTNKLNFSAFLGTAPIVISSQAQIIELPRGSRIALISQQKELKHTLVKLDQGVVVGYRNEFIGADRNAIEAFDLVDALKLGADGCAHIAGGEEQFIIMAKPAPVWTYDEKHPPMHLEKPHYINRFNGALWVRIMTTNGTSGSVQNPMSSIPDDIATAEIDFNPATNQTPDDDINFGRIVETPDLHCQARCIEEKIEGTRSVLLAKVFNLSLESAIALRDHFDSTVNKTLTKISLYKPEIEWENLSVAARKMIDVKFKLRDEGQNIPPTERLKLAHECYLQPPDPATFDRIYYELQKNLMAERTQDTATRHIMRTSPSTILLKALLINSPEKIRVFLSNFQYLNGTDAVDTTISHLTPPIINSLLPYSVQQATIFLHDFELNTLLFPGCFDQVAWSYDHLKQQDAGMPNTYDIENSLVQKRDTLIRALGFEQAKPKLVSAVLRSLRFNGMTLAGSYGLNLRDFGSRPELLQVIGMNVFSYREKHALLEEVRSQTGFSQHYPIGTPEAAVDKMLTLFPDGKDLIAAAHAGDVDTFFNQLITLQLALENGVSRADPKKLEILWDSLLAQRLSVPGLATWMQHLTQTYPVATLDRLIAASNGLYDIAKNQSNLAADAHPPISPTLRSFAKRLVRSEIRTQVLGGSSPASIAALMHTFLERYLGDTPAPTSIQDWAVWLTIRAAKQVYPEATSNGPPHQKYINAVRDYAVEWMSTSATAMPTLPELSATPSTNITARFNRPEQRLLEDDGVLARSKFRNLNITLGNASFNVIRIAIEGSVTTAYKMHGADYNDNFLADQNFLFGQLLARDSFTGAFYSNKFPKGLQGAKLTIGGRLISAAPSLALLLKMKDDLTDFSNHNGSAIFDKTFNVSVTDINLQPHPDPRALFTFLYENSWTYRVIINADKMDRGKWTIIYGQAPHLKVRSKLLCMPVIDQLPHLRQDFDMTGAPQKPSPERLYLQLWLDIFLRQKEPAYADDYTQGPTVMLANIILDQVGLLTYERWSHHQPTSPPELRVRLHQARLTAWENRVSMKVLAQLVPPSLRLAVFSSNAEQNMTVKPMLARMAELPRPPYSEPLFSTISIADGEINQQYRDNFLRIFSQLFENNGMWAQLMTKYGDSISAANPWRLVYVDRQTSPDILDRFVASHRVDQQTRTVYFTDPTLSPSMYLTTNGPAPLSFMRLVVQIGLEMLLDVPVLKGENACESRGEIVPFVDWVLKEANYKSPSATSAAITDPADLVATMNMQKNVLSACRRTRDENAALSDQL